MTLQDLSMSDLISLERRYAGYIKVYSSPKEREGVVYQTIYDRLHKVRIEIDKREEELFFKP